MGKNVPVVEVLILEAEERPHISAAINIPHDEQVRMRAEEENK
jgi:hypothetical protein